ncbi:hypothetical protein GGTG_12784 [Gaeumannomyces tritici R3-111a-1]|uniref:Uncharacterized protein n=1 Tax=Gaeumannomyces tritici (strain R3-111a-1) TaxID=644352 RepID=J3PH04_GAET3|nr:hypothetical protein GGTG_12784 [Gaeumannomyces tritici R3-111a-1]EJT69901.1 hypothetical protein GGTG_12784 [Gaeumannomyces tritici R3-111a-1]
MLDCIEVVQVRPPFAKPEGQEEDATVPAMARVLHQHCTQLLAKYSADAIFEAALAEAVALVNEEHNSNAAPAGLCLRDLTEAEGVLSEVKWAAACIVRLCQTHLRRCSSAKRYRLVE